MTPKGASQEKNTGLFGSFSHTGGKYKKRVTFFCVQVYDDVKFIIVDPTLAGHSSFESLLPKIFGEDVKNDDILKFWGTRALQSQGIKKSAASIYSGTQNII